MQWAIYARVSTSDQDPASQLFALRKHAAEQGLVIFKEYVDQITGSFEKRKKKGITAPALDEMMRDVRAGRVKGVIVWKFDRFARSLMALVAALTEFNRLGVEFQSLTQRLDLMSPTGRLMFQILAALSEWERELIVERCKAGMANARAKGVQIGPPERDPSAKGRALILKQGGLTLREIGLRLGYSSSGVLRMLRRLARSGETSGAPSPA